MKIASIDNRKTFTAKNTRNNKNNIAFKSSMVMGTLGFTGALMESIEKQGYFLSFLIQDGLGMTIPRVATGFHRDKEITGKYNIKEGLEVLGREGMTGPFMMAVAPLMVFLTGKFCKSASTNTRLIKTIGQNFKELLNSNKFSDAVKKDKNLFKKEFYNLTLEKLYKDTIPNDKNAKETLEYIKTEFEKFANSKTKKIREEASKNILNKLNEKITETNSDFDKIYTLTMNINGKAETHSSDDFLKALKNYGIDAIERNKNFSKIDAVAADNITNNFATKRLMFNVGSIAATLGGLSIIPKLYAFSDVAPGAVQLVDKKDSTGTTSDKISDSKKEPQFRGKGINSEGILSKIGKFLHEKIPNWIKREFEYNGINFTNTLMACLSFFGLLIPRSIRAYTRAYIDENGKRDMSELHEIWLRDSISSLAVVFTVPILQKAIVSTIENKQGFVLTNRTSNKFIDKINPYSKLHLLSNRELQAIYGSIDTKEKMVNFVKFINEKGGDLEKILSKSTYAKEVFNNKTFSLESIRKNAVSDKNKQIIEFIEKLKDNNATKELIEKLMNDAGKGKQGSIAKLARGFNSVPGFLVTVIISPIILGVLIPMLTYSNTRKTHAKMNAAAAKN